LPDPEAPVSTVIHDTPDTADHPHPLGSETSTLAVAPAAAMVWFAGVSTASQAAPAWVIVNDWPATVIVADRELLLLFPCTA
jgi:hypothetical protein